MKKILTIAGAFAAGTVCLAQSQDTTRMLQMQEIEVVSTRAGATTPVAYTNIGRQEIEKSNYGQDMPFLLLTTPSVVATSDAGTGIGYTGIRVRGTDATRINVTANGISMNDAESHGLFWVNMPDFASSVEDIQIQRGVGTSTSGAGAFGASINLKTESASTVPYAELHGGYGSFNTHRETLKVGTGLINGKWSFDARLSNIHSDGYVRRAKADLKSYFAQGTYYGRTTVVKFITFTGKEKTYHAWNGIDKAQMDADRRYNTSGEIEQVVRDSDGKPVYDSKGNVVTELTGYYKDETDNYRQRNYQLHILQSLGKSWKMNMALHYTDGWGYYEQYKNARTLEEYGLKPFAVGDPALEAYVKNGLVTKSNLIRRKMMDNGFGGAVFSFDHISDNMRASIGGGANHYAGDHWGRVMWVQNYSGDPDFSPNHEYYRNKGKKTDVNFYARADWRAARRLYIYGDVQYRYINYKIDGANDNWDYNIGQMQRLAVNENFNFFNPKVGIYYRFDPRHNLYASFSVAHKEPTRNNYTDAKTDVRPRAERLFDYEAGYNYRSRFLSAGLNFYFMDYKDQLILTGKLNHIGEPLADNIPDSYRMGIEITAGARFTHWLRWDITATFSRNKIKKYTEYLDDYDQDWNALYTQTPNYLGTTTISFSPAVIVNSLISADFGKWNLGLMSNYVSRQYLTNSERKELSLAGYFLNNLHASYTFALPSVKSITIGASVNNLFNVKYSSNGWGSSSYIYDAAGNHTRSEYAGYFPQAGIHFMTNITLRF